MIEFVETHAATGRYHRIGASLLGAFSLLSIVCVSCQSRNQEERQSSPPVSESARSSSDAPTLGNRANADSEPGVIQAWKTLKIGTCCAISIPGEAIDKGEGTMIDSIAFEYYSYGDIIITADLMPLNGLPAGRKELVRDQAGPGEGGYWDYFEVPVKDSGRPARFVVSVFCKERDCSIADTVLNSISTPEGIGVAPQE